MNYLFYFLYSSLDKSAFETGRDSANSLIHINQKPKVKLMKEIHNSSSKKSNCSC